MSIDFNKPRKIRDRRLRRSILDGLYALRQLQRAQTDVDGRTLADLVSSTRPGGQKFENDGHAMALINDLKEKGLLHVELVDRRRDEVIRLENMRVRIAATGVSLLEESIGPDPDIDDERNLED